MFSSIQDIKSFLIWCRENKVKSVKLDNMQFELSDLAFIDAYNEANLETLDQNIEIDRLETKQQIEEDEELLFHSSNI
jgi:hypothetical protein